MSDTHELRQIAQTIESNGGWHIAAIKVRAAADELDALAAENERLREALAVAYDAIRAPIDDWKCILERKACDAIRAALAKEPTT